MLRKKATLSRQKSIKENRSAPQNRCKKQNNSLAELKQQAPPPQATAAKCQPPDINIKYTSTTDSVKQFITSSHTKGRTHHTTHLNMSDLDSVRAARQETSSRRGARSRRKLKPNQNLPCVPPFFFFLTKYCGYLLI